MLPFQCFFNYIFFSHEKIFFDSQKKIFFFPSRASEIDKLVKHFLVSSFYVALFPAATFLFILGRSRIITIQLITSTAHMRSNERLIFRDPRVVTKGKCQLKPEEEKKMPDDEVKAFLLWAKKILFLSRVRATFHRNARGQTERHTESITRKTTRFSCWWETFFRLSLIGWEKRRKNCDLMYRGKPRKMVY